MDSQSSTKEKHTYDKFLQHEHKQHKTTQQKTTYPLRMNSAGTQTVTVNQ